MKAIKILVGALVGIVAILFIGSLFIGTNFRASQTQPMKASPDAVFGQLTTPEQWKYWSYWALQDPSMTFTYNDTKSGPGAAYSWKSEKMGNGTLTVTNVETGHYVTVDLEFEGQGKAFGEYIINEGPDGGSVVTSAMNTETHGFIEKWTMRLFARPKMEKAFKATMENMDKYISENPAPAPEPVTDTTATAQAPVESTK